MAVIYCADIYCDDCGNLIKEDIKKKGKVPADPDNEYSYDSDEYPKHCDDDEESDGPQHCGSHEKCVNAEVLPDGDKIGQLLSTNLTHEGVMYLKQMVAEGGLVADFWREQFDWVNFEIDT